MGWTTMPKYRKAVYQKRSPDAAMTPLQRDVALLRGTTSLNITEISEHLGIYRSIVYTALYRPNVQRYIAELQAQKVQVLLQQSVTTLLDADDTLRAQERERKAQRRARMRASRPAVERTEAQRKQMRCRALAALRAWHISQGHKVRDIENE